MLQRQVMPGAVRVGIEPLSPGPRAKPEHLRRPLAPRMHCLDCLEDRPVLLVGSEVRLKVAADWLTGQDLAVVFGLNLSALAGRDADGGPAWSLALVDLDPAGDHRDVLALIAEVRRQAREVPVILLSDGFADDHVQPSDPALGDVHLRTPLRFAQLEFGIAEACAITELRQVAALA